MYTPEPPLAITAVPVPPLRPLLSVFTSSGERFVPLSVKLRPAVTLATPTKTDWLLPLATPRTGLEWFRTVTVTVWTAPLFIAAPPKALFVPVSVTVPM